MTDCDQFIPGTRLYDICNGNVNLPAWKINRYREQWGLPPLYDDTKIPFDPNYKPDPLHQYSHNEKQNYGPGTELMLIYKEAGVPTCSQCKNLAQKMNELGIEWCEKNIDVIIEDILPRAMQWVESNKPWVDKLFPTIIKKSAIKFKIKTDVSLAIENAKQEKNKKLRINKRPNVNTLVSPIANRSGCGCQKNKQKKEPYKPTYLSHKTTSSELILSTTFGPIYKDNKPKIENITSLPFDGDPIVNLMYHIYPIGDKWMWNLDQLLERISLFNGRKIIGIVVDEKSATPDEVRKYIGSNANEYLIYENHSSQHEMRSFEDQLKELETNDPNHITFRAHAKGVSNFTVKHTRKNKKSDHIIDWVEMLYTTNLDNFDLVKEHLTESAMTGSCRKFGQFKNDMNKATYSGSFYWFRNCHVFAREWKPKHVKRWACEEWPGSLFSKDDTRCLFLDNVQRLYSAEYWNQKVLPQYKTWKNDHTNYSNM